MFKNVSQTVSGIYWFIPVSIDFAFWPWTDPCYCVGLMLKLIQMRERERGQPAVKRENATLCITKKTVVNLNCRKLPQTTQRVVQ